MLQLKNVSKDFGDKIILDKASLTVYEGEHIAIIGNNGVGKTTVLNLIMGNDFPLSGEVVCNETVDMLSQSLDEECKMNDENLNYASGEFLKILKELSFFKQQFDFKTLSCGEKTKIAIARVFSSGKNILLLDEPTNHLDISAKNVLIDKINAYAGTVIIVSHDKDFLNKTVFKIVEIKNGGFFEYYGNYDDYEQQKENHQLCVKRNYEKHKKNVKKINEQIDKYTGWLHKADKNVKRQGGQPSDAKLLGAWCIADCAARSLSRFVANRVTKLKQELDKDVEKPERQHNIRYALNVENLSNKVVLKFSDVSKSFGNKAVLSDVNFLLKTGDKLAIMGDNGAGKTTILNLILESLSPDKGEIYKTPALKIATMFQDVYDLDPDATINKLSMQGDKQFRTDFITNLCSMNIDKSRFNSKIKNLSMGERMRIKLALLILSDANLIIMDEPTNHLDIENKNYLETVLKGFKGTLIVVSHDLDFLKNVTNKTLMLKNSKATYFDINITP